MDEERMDLATEIVERELDAGGVAALARVYEKAFAQLAPVIGDNGVRGIFARALELAKGARGAAVVRPRRRALRDRARARAMLRACAPR